MKVARRKARQEITVAEVKSYWNDGYFVRSVGDEVTATIIRKYIEYQAHEDNSKQLAMLGNPSNP
jgi:REP element-mobilizing transposase RayT